MRLPAYSIFAGLANWRRDWRSHSFRRGHIRMEQHREQLEETSESAPYVSCGESQGESSAVPFAERLAAARSGSLTAVAGILEECRNYLLLIANRELGSSIQAKIGASDLVHESLLQGQQAFRRFQGTSRHDVMAWLRKSSNSS